MVVLMPYKCSFPQNSIICSFVTYGLFSLFLISKEPDSIEKLIATTFKCIYKKRAFYILCVKCPNSLHPENEPV